MLEIRRATEQDIPALEPLYRDFFTLHRLFLGNPKPLSKTRAVKITRGSLAKPNSWLLVAYDTASDEIAAFARWEQRGGAFFGEEIFVREAYRKQGVGYRLLGAVEKEVIRLGGDALFISIVPHNREMLAFAFEHGYDTLNTLELRKDLKGGSGQRDSVELFGLEFNLI